MLEREPRLRRCSVLFCRNSSCVAMFFFLEILKHSKQRNSVHRCPTYYYYFSNSAVHHHYLSFSFRGHVRRRRPRISHAPVRSVHDRVRKTIPGQQKFERGTAAGFLCFYTISVLFAPTLTTLGNVLDCMKPPPNQSPTIRCKRTAASTDAVLSSDVSAPRSPRAS